MILLISLFATSRLAAAERAAEQRQTIKPHLRSAATLSINVHKMSHTRAAKQNKAAATINSLNASFVFVWLRFEGRGQHARERKRRGKKYLHRLSEISSFLLLAAVPAELRLCAARSRRALRIFLAKSASDARMRFACELSSAFIQFSCVPSLAGSPASVCFSECAPKFGPRRPKKSQSDCLLNRRRANGKGSTFVRNMIEKQEKEEGKEEKTLSI